jgi:hypothetical protein
MTEGAYARPRKEFKVGIDLELPSDVLERIGRAIQKAVLTELADVDVASGYSVVLRGPNGSGGVAGREAAAGVLSDAPEDDEPTVLPGLESTDGIWIREEEPPL